MHSKFHLVFLLLFAVFVGLLATPAEARQDGGSGDDFDTALDELRTPYSPAFSLLGVAPTSIERPSGPREFVTTITSNLDAGSRDIPTDLAIEFSPYWWVDRPGLTYKRYETEKDIWQTMLQTFSISIATTEISDRSTAPGEEGTRLGFGLRFQLLEGSLPDALAPALQDAESALDSRDAARAELGDKEQELREAQLLYVDVLNLLEFQAELTLKRDRLVVVEQRLSLLAGTDPDRASLEEKEDELNKEIKALETSTVALKERLEKEQVDIQNLEAALVEQERSVDAAGQALRDIDRRRYGWSAEFAAAAAADFREGDASSGQFTRGAGWFTLAYTPAESIGDGDNRSLRAGSFTALALGRVQWEDIDGADDQSYDLGGRAMWRMSGAPVTLSTEFLHRFAEGRNDTERWTVMAEYQLDSERAVVASFGSNFDSEFEGDSDLIASIGFSLGFGAGPSADFRRDAQRGN